jgi:hypothetical protein
VASGKTQVISCRFLLTTYVLRLTTKKFFKNLEEVKNDSRGSVGGASHLRGSMKNMGFDCINRIDAGRIDVAQMRNTCNALIERSRA